MKPQGFFQTPQNIMEKYNGCSAPQYRRYSPDKPIHANKNLDKQDITQILQALRSGVIGFLGLHCHPQYSQMCIQPLLQHLLG